ncbi:MAG: exodeoxyribonuclease V subunit gamma [Fibrobacterota bacterium]|nr:MAG: exodeoxyribonuclease V subunit gamma [Fibrobacterota bacterium]
MALHLHFANRLEPLVAELSELLDGLWTDLAQPPPVVVPSPAVAKWLKLRLCEARGILVNLPTPTLESVLWSALDPEPGQRILRVEALSQAIAPLFDTNLLANDSYRSVRRYLETASGIDPRRRWQLAQAVAKLFLEYEYNRPSVWREGRWAVEGLDHRWPRRGYFSRASAQEVDDEIWQRELHGEVFSATGPLAGTGLLGLPRLHRLRREAGWRPQGGTLILFGLEKVSHFHRNLVLELSEGREVHLFLQNPCAEFWEDVDTSRRARKRHGTKIPKFSPDDYQAQSLADRFYPAQTAGAQADPKLLERWGRSSRENTSLWCQATDYDFSMSVEPPVAANADPTALSTLQHCLTRRHPGPGISPLELEDGRILSETLPADRSIRLLSCPERTREMEAVRDQLLDWLSEDPSRMVSDAVVLLPDPSRHRAAIEAVFASRAPGDPGFIPHTVLGAAGSESLWARGVESLLRLCQEPADRPGVFALLRNPLCQAKLGVDADTVATWESWAETSGMLRAWDGAHRREAGDAASVAHDPHTFKAGLARLYLEPLAHSETSIGLSVPEGFGERISPVGDFQSDLASVDRFAQALEGLFHQTRALASLCASERPSALARELGELCDRWLDPGTGPESRMRRQFLETIGWTSLQDAFAERRLDLAELSEIAKSALESEHPAPARAFAGSLTFAPLRAGHILPHDFVAVAGLDADSFPGSQDVSGIDLVAKNPLVGDLHPVRDNRSLFLQTILSARERLVVSWLSQDLQKDVAKEPSSVVMELEEALADIAQGRFRETEPLLAREGGGTTASWDPCDLLDAAHRKESPEASALIPEEDLVQVDLAEIRRFLKNPHSHDLSRRLGWREEELPSTLEASHEVLGTDAREDAIFLSGLFGELASLAWIDLAADPIQRIRKILDTRLWDASFPESLLARTELDSLEEWAAWTWKLLAALRGEFPEHTLAKNQNLSLGTADRESGIRWRKDVREFVVSGRIPLALVHAAKGHVVVLECVKMDKGNKDGPKVRTHNTYNTWVNAAALQASGWPRVEIRFAPRESGLAWVRREVVGSWKEWMSDLVGDLSQGAREYLPARAILEHRPLSPFALREELEDAAYPDPWDRLLCPALPGESEDDPTDFTALVQRRLGPLLALDGSVVAEVEDA